jgi:hypothetical protein
MSIYKELQKKHPEVTGKLIVTKNKDNKIIVSGQLNANNVEELKNDLISILLKQYKQIVSIAGVKFNEGFTVIEDEVVTTNHQDKNKAGAVKILYNGMLPVSAIKKDEKFKLFTQINFDKMDNAVIELKFIAPIILDSNLNIIDGNMRYDLAVNNNIQEVPVIIIDDNGLKADMLRLILNRSSEFQRWNYDAVSPFVDSIPVAQPILEPLGFFGEKLLPESYFSNTMFEYKIDVFNNQQGKYTQDTTIADWAEFRRAEIQANQEAIKKQREKKKKQKMKTRGAKSLFDLFQPTEDDFVETYNMDEEVQKQVDEVREVASKITESYDKERKAIIEEKGLKWQNKTTQSKTKAANKREEFINYVNSLNIEQELKDEIFSNMDTFDTEKELKDYVKGILESDE